MDGQSRIVRINGLWTTIQCGKCEDCFIVLTGKHKWQMGCPYCSHLIEIAHEPEIGVAAESKTPILDGMARVGVDAFNSLPKLNS